MIWVAIVALGNMGVSIWLVRENRRLTQMVISKSGTEFATMVRAETSVTRKKKTKKAEESYHTWRNPSEGVAP